MHGLVKWRDGEWFGSAAPGNLGPAMLPSARGPLSRAVLGMMSGDITLGPPVAAADPLSDDDLHLALFLCYELHYRAIDGVDD